MSDITHASAGQCFVEVLHCAGANCKLALWCACRSGKLQSAPAAPSDGPSSSNAAAAPLLAQASTAQSGAELQLLLQQLSERMAQSCPQAELPTADPAALLAMVQGMLQQQDEGQQATHAQAQPCHAGWCKADSALACMQGGSSSSQQQPPAVGCSQPLHRQSKQHGQPLHDAAAAAASTTCTGLASSSVPAAESSMCWQMPGAQGSDFLMQTHTINRDGMAAHVVDLLSDSDPECSDQPVEAAQQDMKLPLTPTKRRGCNLLANTAAVGSRGSSPCSKQKLGQSCHQQLSAMREFRSGCAAGLHRNAMPVSPPLAQVPVGCRVCDCDTVDLSLGPGGDIYDGSPSPAPLMRRLQLAATAKNAPPGKRHTRAQDSTVEPTQQDVCDMHSRAADCCYYGSPTAAVGSVVHASPCCMTVRQRLRLNGTTPAAMSRTVPAVAAAADSDHVTVRALDVDVLVLDSD